MTILALLLACMPSPPQNHTFDGPGVKVRQTVKERFVTLELLEPSGATRWKVERDPGLFHPVFRADGRYVAEASELHDDSVRVFGPDGKVAVYQPITLASDDEKSLMGASSCGIEWFGGLRFDGDTLVVLLNQAPPRPPIYAPDPTPKLEIQIDVVAGKMSRRSAAKVVTVEGLIATYRGDPAKQLEAALGMMRKAQQPGGEKLSALASFAKDELPKSKDAQVQAALLAVLDRTGSDADREWVGTRALDASWPAFPVITMLQRIKGNPQPQLAYARALLEQKQGDVNARATAVRVLAPTPDGLKYLKLAQQDPERYVRDAAAGALRELPASDESLDFLLERADQAGARIALVQRFIDRPYGGPPNPGLARFEKACDAKLQKKWPGCEAWTGAMADVRGELGLARKRYKHALAEVTAELERERAWSAEVETFFRLHVRLAQLAKADKKPKEIAAHVEAMQRSKWWDQFRVDCSSGLPRSLAAECDGGHYRELLISELEGKPPPR